MSSLAFKVQNLSKVYHLGTSTSQFLTRAASDFLRNINPFLNKKPAELTTFWALKDINFDIEQGDIVGIIGRNGAGKSTLLKVLSKITYPTTGKILINGRVGSLLEVGTGFHPELTGKENVYLNGSILGMRKYEIQEKLDEIIDFSGVEKFIHTPVKRYSSGMYVRLAFSVAAHLNSEVLIVDEVLAVGDAEFQKKCLGKMRNVAGNGRTVLFVSHNMSAIETLCTNGIYLKSGKIEYMGDIQSTIDHYSHDLKYDQISLDDFERRKGTGNIRVVEILIVNENGKNTISVRSGSSIQIKIKLKSLNREFKKTRVAIDVLSDQGSTLFRLINENYPNDLNYLGEFVELICTVPNLPLNTGNYFLTISVVNYLKEVEDYVEAWGPFSVESGDFFGGGVVDKHIGKLLINQFWTISTK